MLAFNVPNFAILAVEILRWRRMHSSPELDNPGHFLALLDVVDLLAVDRGVCSYFARVLHKLLNLEDCRYSLVDGSM
jgi:hypothetical protein